MRDKEKAKDCCSREYHRLVDKITACENNAENQNERHICYRSEARESGARVRKCIDTS